MIEIMMAVTIFSFAVLPLALFVRSGSKTVEGTRDIAGAVCLAQETVELCRSFPYHLLVREPTTPAGVETAEEEIKRDRSITMGRIAYTRQAWIRPVTSSGGLEGRLLRLKITWQPRTSEKPFEYETWTVLSPLK